MLKRLSIGCVALALAGGLSADQMQGVIVDWNCVKPMVKDGRANTLKNNHNCSMMKNWNRGAYGLITSDQKYYRLQDPGNSKIKQLLKDTPDKDNLKVVVNGTLQGDTLTVETISEL